jgi:8-oxo-dGTP pyrophosphatase MutT (NUDIX family)
MIDQLGVWEPASVQRIAAYGLAIRFDQVLLSKIVRSVRGGVGQWMIPGGGVEHGEHLAETIVREFLEETGLTVTIGELLYVGSDRRTVPLRSPDRSAPIAGPFRRSPLRGTRTSTVDVGDGLRREGGVYPQIVDRAISPR